MRPDIPGPSAAGPPSPRSDRARHEPALGALLGLGTLVAVVLISFAHGYGYHRDELYFLVAGHHLAWSYPDQGPLTPLLARLMSDIAPTSLTVLRIPSALMAGGCVVVSGLIAHELGGTRRAQLIAAGCAAASPVVLVVGHLLSTTTFDLVAWSLVTWLIVRGLRTGAAAPWLLGGVIAGIALLNKPLIALLLATVGLGMLIVGPRRQLRHAAPWAAAAIAGAIWVPWLIWQAGHGWPQLHISSAIASGSSASSQPRWALVPFQFLLAGPPLAAVWVVGLVGLARGAALRRYRSLAVSWLLLVCIFEVAGGKPYYLAGLLPALFAAGAVEVDRWLDRGRAALRRGLVIAAVALSAAVSAILALPILPVGDAGVPVAMNSDVGETIGWPAFARELTAAYAQAPKPAVIFTENYGEAGAVDRFGPSLGLPAAFSGHNGFADWGPPSGAQRSVVVVGLSRARLSTFFRGCRSVVRISNPAGIDNDENGELIALCTSPRASWPAIWPQLRHLS